MAAGMLLTTTSAKLTAAPNQSCHFRSARDVVRDAAVERRGLARGQHGGEQWTQLGRDQGDGRWLGARAPDRAPEPLQPAAIEQLTDQEQGAVDDAPGDVAPDDGDQQLARARAPFVFDDQTGAERERQRHDESEQDLGQSRRRVEIAMDQRSAIRARRVGIGRVHWRGTL